MTIYEIDNEILNCIDEETGEVIDLDRLNSLLMEKEQKIANVARWYKGLLAEAEAIKAEKMALAKRQQVCENKAESLKNWLAMVLNGEKFKDGAVSISYRKSEQVQFADNFSFDNLPGEFIKTTIEAKKSDLKAALKEGRTFEGVALVEKNNIQIK